MNKTYEGLVSNPVNNNDTYVPDNRTITFQGVVVQTPIEIPEPIEPQSEVPVIEVFSDADCTTYATGELDTVYVRINKDIELTPDTELPGEANAIYGDIRLTYYTGGWYISAFVDFYSQDISPDQPNPFKDGAVFECTAEEGFDPVDVTGMKTVLYESDRTV